MNAVDTLAQGGRVAKELPKYEVRPQQLEMAGAVAEAFEAGEHLLVEAGTGVGKSFAYLIPAIQRAVQHGERVVISTHTIALQEQLIGKDIPFLAKVSPEKFVAVLVKGRSNYLGLRRLTRASQRQGTLFETSKQTNELHAIEDWAYETQDGSLSDLDNQPHPAVWDQVKSESDDCFGRRCPHFKKCFYQRARRRAADAQILVVNHALLFSDLAVRQQGASILPDYDRLILDEAHTVENVAGDHLGASVTSAQLYYLLNSLHSERTGKGVLRGKRGKAAKAAVGRARQTVNDYVDTLTLIREDRRGWNGRLKEPPPIDQPVSAALIELQQQLHELRGKTDDEGDRSELKALGERCNTLAATVAAWHEQAIEGCVYWVEPHARWRRRITLGARPIEVGPLLKELLFENLNSVVMTSATLATSGQNPFGYIRGRLGLEDVRELKLGSPFNYREQVRIHVPTDMPDPSNGDAFIPATCEAIKKYTALSKGRAFVLFTSHAMMRQCAEELAPFFEAEEMPLLVQDSGMPRSMMLDEFRTVARSVLFGTDTFWAGVDVPGEALSNVIIVKLPFAVPSQPVVEARIERIRETGGNPFMEYQVPEAILKFKQGVGRLIRSREDTGIIVVLDSRVRTKPYGRMFLNALPDCEVVADAASRTENRTEA